MKTLVLGVGVFGFVILNHISKNNKSQQFYAYEKNDLVLKNLIETREHSYFFPGIKLGNNIEFVNDIEKILPSIDLLIISIPSQFVVDTISSMKDYLKPGVTILNLSKGINNKTGMTMGETISKKLSPVNFNYSVLSGGMIAEELLNGCHLGADLGIENKQIGNKIKNIFENDYLEINIVSKDIKNIELYGAFKNIIAIGIGYYESKGYGASTLGYFLCKFYYELKDLIDSFGGNKELNFSDFSLGSDLIATCFGNSRNRLFGNLLGQGKKLEEILETLAKENKISEGYETFKLVYKITKDKPNFKEINKIGKQIFN